MTEIKAVLFDYGNVLCMPQQPEDLGAMAACLGAPLNILTTLYWQMRDEYDLGTLDGRAYWTKIASKCGSPISEEQLCRLIDLDNLGWTRPNNVMTKWAAQLREGGIRTAIISNMPKEIREYLRECEWLPAFDHYTFSCDVNSVKPASDIYMSCLEGLRERPKHALFIDDRQMNVDAAVSLGIPSVVFSDAQTLQPYIQTLGLPDIALNARV